MRAFDIRSQNVLSAFGRIPTIWWLISILTLWAFSYQYVELVVLYSDKIASFFLKTYNERLEIILILPAVAVLLLILDWVKFGWRASSLRSVLNPSRNEWNDIISFLIIASQGHMIAGFAFSFGLAAYAPGFVRSVVDVNLIHQLDSIFLQYLFFFLLIDFVDYWLHRAQHSWRFLWHTHHFHHSATNFDILNAKRNHPFEIVGLKRLLFTIPVAIVGVPIETVLWYHVFREAISFLSHSKFNFNFGWMGKYLLVSPNYHKVHHTVEEEMMNYNYGNVLIIWDRLFGTYYEPEKSITHFGVAGSNHNQSDYFRIIINDYVKFWRDLLRLDK